MIPGVRAAKPHILCVFGTRPEAIKLAPVIRALADAQMAQTVCATAQHRELLDGVLQSFDIRLDIDLDLMTPNQDLDALTARVLGRTKEVIASVHPDMVLVQGDTTSAMAAALAAFHAEVPVGHVEAGLRTGFIEDPWPEEANRRIITQVASLHFAPTEHARDNLLAEGVDPARIEVTGNTAIDALELVTPQRGTHADERTVLVTCHRRENYHDEFRSVIGVLGHLSESFPELRFLCPLHPNPRVREPLSAGLAGLSNFELCEPLEYPAMLGAIADARAVVTDSGGVQEEAAWYGTPALVLRDHTDRPESVDAGVAFVVGHTAGLARQLLRRVLDEPPRSSTHVFGDGDAAPRIVAFLRHWLDHR